MRNCGRPRKTRENTSRGDRRRESVQSDNRQKEVMGGEENTENGIVEIPEKRDERTNPMDDRKTDVSKIRYSGKIRRRTPPTRSPNTDRLFFFGKTLEFI